MKKTTIDEIIKLENKCIELNKTGDTDVAQAITNGIMYARSRGWLTSKAKQYFETVCFHQDPTKPTSFL